jgi:hypothetical protein
MTAVRRVQVEELNDGVIDLFSGTWICETHETKMKPGIECAFCAVERDGIGVLDRLASHAS